MNKNIKENFKKVRVNKKNKKDFKDTKVEKLIEIRNKLLDDQEKESKIEEIEALIADTEAKINRNKIMENFQAFSENPENVNLQQVWKLIDKLWPKKEPKLPAGKKNHKGILVTESNQIKQLLAKEYRERLRETPIRPDFENLSCGKKKILKQN